MRHDSRFLDLVRVRYRALAITHALRVLLMGVGFEEGVATQYFSPYSESIEIGNVSLSIFCVGKPRARAGNEWDCGWVGKRV